MKCQNFELADDACPEPEVAGSSSEGCDGFGFCPLVVIFLWVTKKNFKNMLLKKFNKKAKAFKVYTEIVDN